MFSGEGESEVIMIHMNHFIELKAHSTNSNSVTIVSPWSFFFFILVYILQRGIGKRILVFTFDKLPPGCNFVRALWRNEKN